MCKAFFVVRGSYNIMHGVLARSYLDKIHWPSRQGSDLKNNDWIQLPADDLDSFIDMIETAKDSARENLKVIELKICDLAQTPQETASHKRLRTSPSPSPSPKSGCVHACG